MNKKVIPARVYFNNNGEDYKPVQVLMIYEQVSDGYSVNIVVKAEDLPEQRDDLNEDLFIAAEEALGGNSIREFEFDIAGKV
jgi:hypothetical protein